MQQTSFIFDLDGTIWDSRPWFKNVITSLSGGTASKLTKKLEQEVNSVKLAKSYGISVSRLIRVANDRSCGTASLYEGVTPTLEKLRTRNAALGIVSNLPGRLALSLMESTGISQYFKKNFVVTSRPGIPSKPQPHGIRQLILNMAQCHQGNEVWFVGDTETDAAAAISAGVKFAWASYGYGLKQPECSVRVLQQFDELLEL